MEFAYNNRFLKLTEGNNIESFKNKVKPPLMKLLNDDFIKIDGCHYYSFMAPNGPFSKDLTDRTGNEAFFNKIQIDDYLELENELDFFIQGVGYSILLFEKLEKCYTESFRVIFSYDGSFANVTFYKVRDGESWLSDDLENYKLESILVISPSEHRIK
ncbi:hypothetical protein ABWH96_10945 [Marivirga tractuosa]|uniref:hypothetical protein n=1 Tax=Marivirga tractuosa TaxID=1006 RepID=UPI0035CF9A25